MGYIAADIKSRNRNNVYRIFQRSDEISRIDLSRITGISNPTILKIVTYFLELGIIEETVKSSSTGGRKAQMLKLVPSAFYSIGINFEGDFLSIGLVDLCGDVLKLAQIPAEKDYRTVFCRQIPDLIKKYISENDIPVERILGAGIGVPAIVDNERFTIKEAQAIGVSSETDYSALIGTLSTTAGLPIVIENDANAAAIGEHFARRFQGTKDLLYVSLGTGLGSGVVLNGNLRTGQGNYCGEVGYMSYSSSFVSSIDRPGWMESRLNIKSLKQKSRAFADFIDGRKADITAADDGYHDLLDFVASELALTLANINCVLDVEDIVIGGITVKAFGAPLHERVNEYLHQFSARSVKCSNQKCLDATVAGVAMIATDRQLAKLFEA